MSKVMTAHRGHSPARPRRRLIVVVVVLMVVLIVAVPVVAAWLTTSPTSRSSSWRAVGLREETDALLSVPFTSGLVYAGTPSGVRRSTDSGSQWSPDRGWPAGVAVLSLALDPHDKTIVAGGGNGVVYIRADRGALGWRRISPVLGGNPLFSVAVDATAKTILVGTVGVLYRGESAGGTWRWRVAARTGDSSITSIVWAPWDARRTYASVFGVRPAVISSGDAGVTWRADARGLPATLPSQSLLANSSTKAIWLSTMGGGVWRRLGTGEWRGAARGLPQRHAMPLIADGNGVLYAGTMGDGVFTTGAANIWHSLGTGLTGGKYIVLSLALTGGSPASVLAGTSIGVFRYTITS